MIYPNVPKRGPAVRTPPEVVSGNMSTTGAARDHLGGARSITPPRCRLRGPTSNNLSKLPLAGPRGR